MKTEQITPKTVVTVDLASLQTLKNFADPITDDRQHLAYLDQQDWLKIADQIDPLEHLIIERLLAGDDVQPLVDALKRLKSYINPDYLT